MLLVGSKFVGVAAAAVLLALSGAQASFLDKPSVATYWGQNSKGQIDSQKPLSYYCDDLSDVLVMSFTLNFKDGGLPLLNLANGCNGPVFPGTSLLSCPQVGEDIKTCQKKGKTVLMSLGGAAGSYGFANNADAEAFADTLWNIYGAGKSSTRPFGDAVLDGFDLDIEGGGPTGYAAMVKRLRSHFSKDNSKKYYITGAPQCPFPDAIMGTVMDDVGFDAVMVQFYNNYCATASGSFNFNTWDTWAKKTSPNKNVKILLGIPGSAAAAGSGYVPFDQLKPIVENVYNTYSSFGGVMLWDASASYVNRDVSPSYQGAVASLVHGLRDGKPITTSPAPKPTTTTTIKATTTVKPTTTNPSTVFTSTKTKTNSASSSSAVPTTSIAPTKTTTTTTEIPTPTGTPATCVKEGQACSTHGQYTCSGNSFATCNFGKWTLRGCPSGTTCFSTTDGASIYCAQGTGSNTCPKEKSATTTTMTVLKKPRGGVVKTKTGPAAKPYKNGRVVAQFSVVDSDSKSFSAVINARRLDKRTFGKTITVQFKVAKNIKITNVEGGKVTQKGNNVKIQIKNGNKKSMVSIITLRGTIASGGVFIAPASSSMKFSS